MKKTVTLLLEWNSILISYILTPFLLGILCLFFFEKEAHSGILRFLFEEPFQLSPQGFLYGGIIIMIPWWGRIARFDRRTSFYSALLIISIVATFVMVTGAPVPLPEHREKVLMLMVIFFLYFVRFVSIIDANSKLSKKERLVMSY